MPLGSTEFSIRFDGRVVASGKSTWNYTLCWTGQSTAFSHLVLELCSGLGQSNIVMASPAAWTWGDPLRHDDPSASGSARINGIKWGSDPFGGSAGAVAFSFKLNSVFPVGAGAIRAHISDGAGSLHDGHADIDGPVCAATPTRTATPCPTKTDSSSHPGWWVTSTPTNGCPSPTPTPTPTATRTPKPTHHD